MRIETRSGAGPFLAACLAVCLVIGTASAKGVQPTRAPSATLELYALESERAAVQMRLAALAAERRDVTRERASARARLAAAEGALRAAQQQLAQVVRALYEIGETDELVVLLGAGSLEEAMSGIDSLERTAAQSRTVSRQARAARTSVARAAAALGDRERRLAALESEARRDAAALASAIELKREFLAELARRESAAHAATAARVAEAAQRRSAELTPSPAAAPPPPGVAAEPVDASRGVRQLTVDAVAYSLPGTTASGLPVGHGVVAVDPSVIPLGTRMLVPGYGPAVAGDVGTAVKGLVIDLWFPTLGEAQAWGRRTVTITLR